MRAFTAGLAAVLAGKTDLVPVWILRLTAGATDYTLSSDEFDLAGWGDVTTTLPWVSEWGALRESISGGALEISVADIEITLAVDLDADPNAATLATQYDLEASPCSLYLWATGLDPVVDPPHEMLRGYVDDIHLPDTTNVRLVIIDETSRLDAYIGTRITTDLYPDADPDDVGALIPIVYGSVDRVPARAVEAGAMTSLPAAIDALQTSVTVSDAGRLDVGMVLQIDDEQVAVTDVVGDTLTVTRGASDTLAATHKRGAMAWEVRNEFVYLAADHPVDSIDRVLGVVGQAEMDITGVCTLYTGQLGDEHPSYPAMAAISVPGYITVQQAVDLVASLTGEISQAGQYELIGEVAKYGGYTLSGLIALLGSIQDYAINNANHAHSQGALTTTIRPDTATVASGDTITSPNDYGYNSINGLNGGTGTLGGANGVTLKFQCAAPQGLTGTPIRMRVACILGIEAYSNATMSLYVGSVQRTSLTVTHNDSIYRTAWYSISSWDVLFSTTTWAQFAATSGYSLLKEMWFEVEYDPSTTSAATAVSKTLANNGTLDVDNGLNLSGEITVDNGTLNLGGGITIDTGSLDVAVSGNSTANTLVGDTLLVAITRAATVTEIAADVLTRAGWSGAAPGLSGELPAGYALAGVIDDYRPAKEWLYTMAWQLRCAFRVRTGVPILIVRPDVVTPTASLPAVRVDAAGNWLWSRQKTDRAELVNAVTIYYDRDWSRRGAEAYRATTAEATDPASIAIHGRRERPDLWQFDFVQSPAMAESLRDFYLADLATRRWLHTIEAFLDRAALEYGDGVTLEFDAAQVGQVVDAGMIPGKETAIDVVRLVIRA